MAILLSEHEGGATFDGDAVAALLAVQERLARIQRALIAHRRRAVVMIEGWHASGKGDTIRRLAAAWDPRHVAVWPIGATTPEERSRHFLWRFWAKLPADGQIAVFDRGWYGRVLAERVVGLVTEKEWRRAYDEINEYEAQQKDSGTTIVKLFLHVTQAEQDARFRTRLADPWRRATMTADVLHQRDRRADHIAAIEQMFERTDTRWAPWKIIDATHEIYAFITALAHIADVLEKAVPMKPPEADAEMIRLAREQLGVEVEG